MRIDTYIPLFRKKLEERRTLSADSLNRYGHDLQAFLDFLGDLGGINSDLDSIKPHDIKLYMTWMNVPKRWRKATQARRLRTLKRMFRAARVAHLTTADPFNGLKFESGRGEKRVLRSASATDKMIAAKEREISAGKKKRTHRLDIPWDASLRRDLAILLVQKDTGASVPELQAMRFWDLSQPKWIGGIGQRLNERTRAALRRYLEAVEHVRKPDVLWASLRLTTIGEAMSRRAIQTVLS